MVSAWRFGVTHWRMVWARLRRAPRVATRQVFTTSSRQHPPHQRHNVNVALDVQGNGSQINA